MYSYHNVFFVSNERCRFGACHPISLVCICWHCRTAMYNNTKIGKINTAFTIILSTVCKQHWIDFVLRCTDFRPKTAYWIQSTFYNKSTIFFSLFFSLVKTRGSSHEFECIILKWRFVMSCVLQKCTKGCYSLLFSYLVQVVYLNVQFNFYRPKEQTWQTNRCFFNDCP